MNKKELTDYKALQKFWDKTLGNGKAEAINKRWIRSKNVNGAFKDFLFNGCKVLDYGCGSGWGLLEMANYCDLGFGLGVDTSHNAVIYCSETAKLSGFDKLVFKQGDQTSLSSYKQYFDFAWTINTLDVVPDDIVKEIIVALKRSVKKGGYLFVGLNPDFTVDFLLTKIKMTQEGHYFYKDGVLRANKKSVKEWETIFEKEFEVLRSFKFVLVPQERKFPRVGFILKNSK